MTHQEAFDRVWEHFVENRGKPSFGPDCVVSACAYRGPDGAKCAVGVLIPDDVYLDDFENSLGVMSLLSDRPDIASLLGEVATDAKFLGELQSAHDDAVAVSEGTRGFASAICRYLRELAVSYRLKVPANA